MINSLKNQTFLIGLFCSVCMFLHSEQVSANYNLFDSNHPAKFIYTNSPVNSYIYVQGQASSISTSAMLMDLLIEHDFIGELIVQLVSPQRHTITISYLNGFGTVLSFDGQSISSFSSNLPAYINPNGVWSLKVLDIGYYGYGWLQSWALAFPDPDTVQFALGGGLYVTAAGALYYSPTGESVGNVVSGGSAVMLKDARGNALSASSFQAAYTNSGGLIGVVEETDSQTGVTVLKIGLPQYTVPKRSTTRVFSSVMVYSVNPVTGVVGANPVVVRDLVSLLAEESRFQQDFNGDGYVGDVVSIALGGGLYVTSAGALYYSPTGESVGSVVSGGSAVMLKDARGNALSASSFQAAYTNSGGLIGVVEETDSQTGVAVLKIGLPQYTVPKRSTTRVFSSVMVYSVNPVTGVVGANPVVVRDLVSLLAEESRFQLDFNRDGVVGDAVVMDFWGNLYVTSSGGVYYSPGGETVGNVVSGASSVMLRDAKGVALPANVFRTAHTDSGGRIGVVEEIDSQSGQTVLKIGLPQYTVPKRSSVKVFSSVAIYTVNPVTGVSGAPSAVKNVVSVLAEESRFQKDFNQNGTIGI
jgi:subtilisin-like proprotein convertase family protein